MSLFGTDLRGGEDMNIGGKKSNRGFAAMVRSDAGKKRQRMIASAGGQEAHKRGTAHTWTSESARMAGQRGGRARQRSINT